MALSYNKTFDPARSTTRKTPLSAPTGDRRDGLVYLYNDEIVLAVNVALVTGRPLLVRGPSGSGKSSLARNVARVMKRRYYEDVISSSTQARDLLWKFDTVAQLADATAGNKKPPEQYIDPGTLVGLPSRHRRGDNQDQRPEQGRSLGRGCRAPR